MPRKTPQQVAQKWSRNTSAAVNDYRDGINRVDTAPGMLAAAAEDRYRAGIERSLQSGKWRDRVSSVSLSEWKQKTSEVGAARIASGVQQAEGKMQSFMSELLPFQESLVNQINSSMPKGDLEQNIARSQAFQRGMAKFKRGSSR